MRACALFSPDAVLAARSRHPSTIFQPPTLPSVARTERDAAISARACDPRLVDRRAPEAHLYPAIAGAVQHDDDDGNNSNICSAARAGLARHTPAPHPSSAYPMN
ncbi:hypothetical protein PMIN06_003723 [Paraphaeosphaeria minitans]